MNFTIRAIDQPLLPAFSCYLMPPAIEFITHEAPDTLALGIVTDDGRSCGAIAGMLVEERTALIVHSLFVDEAVRRQGLGTALCYALFDVMVGPDTDLIGAFWELPDGPFQEVEDFFLELGFSSEGGGAPVYRLSTTTARRLPLFRRAFSPNFRPDANIVPVREFTEAEMADLLSDEEIDPRLRLSSFSPVDLQSDLCCGYRYSGRIVAYFLVKELSPGCFSLMASLSRKGAHAAAYPQLVAAALHQCLTLLPEGSEGGFWLEAINETIANHVKNLAGDTAEFWRGGCGLLLRDLDDLEEDENEAEACEAEASASPEA